jgi:hypothetical protein
MLPGQCIGHANTGAVQLALAAVRGINIIKHHAHHACGAAVLADVGQVRQVIGGFKIVGKAKVFVAQGGLQVVNKSQGAQPCFGDRWPRGSRVSGRRLVTEYWLPQFSQLIRYLSLGNTATASSFFTSDAFRQTYWAGL